MDYLASSAVNLGQWFWLVDLLSELAGKRESLDVAPDREILVASGSVTDILNHYIQAEEGKTYICFGKSGSGKTTAAYYLLHGDHTNRPNRAIMINAGGVSDFPANFAINRNAPDAAPRLERILCSALVFDQKKKDPSPGTAKLIWNFLSRMRRMIDGCTSPGLEPAPVSLQSGETLGIGAGRPFANRCDLPLLIIDDFAKSTVNSDFLAKLYGQVASTKTTALVLTKDEEWADEMIKINGGVKILPVDHVVGNPKGGSVEPFTEKPQWTGMGWNIDHLHKFAALLGDPDVSSDLREGMTPEQVEHLHARRKLA